MKSYFLNEGRHPFRRENAELTAAYNDLNEDFENHKAEHGSVVTSNRDLTARIGLFIIFTFKVFILFILILNQSCKIVP